MGHFERGSRGHWYEKQRGGEGVIIVSHFKLLDKDIILNTTQTQKEFFFQSSYIQNKKEQNKRKKSNVSP